MIKLHFLTVVLRTLLALSFTTTTTTIVGALFLLPLISIQGATAAVVDDEVTLTETTHRLYYVEDIENIGIGPVTSTDVPAWQLTNNVGMSVTAIAEGANMVQVGCMYRIL